MPKLTKRTVDRLEPQSDADYVVWDAGLPAFGIRVWPSGRKVYFVRYRIAKGVKRYKTIGHHGKITAEHARAKAMEVFARVHHGDDPVAEHTDFPTSLLDIANSIR